LIFLDGFFSKNYNSGNSYEFPDGSSIKAGQTLRVNEDVFGFGLGSKFKGNEFTLHAADKVGDKYITSGAYTGFAPLYLSVDKK